MYRERKEKKRTNAADIDTEDVMEFTPNTLSPTVVSQI